LAAVLECRIKRAIYQWANSDIWTSFSGESAVSFLYTRDRFGWDIRKYTQFGSIVTLLTLCGKFIRKYVVCR
jgi:hypothetical protein